MNIKKILEDRKKTHGEFKNHANITIQLKEVMRTSKSYEDCILSDMQKESLDMICHKIGRILSGNPNHLDHWKDIQGYAKLVEQSLQDENKPK